jgi:hypothetical protein
MTSKGSPSDLPESGRGRRASQLGLTRSGLGMAPRRERSVLFEPTDHTFASSSVWVARTVLTKVS